MTLEENVETLFSQMSSEEGRMIVISQIAGKIDLPRKYLERAIRFYERAQNEREAERLLAIDRAIKWKQENEKEEIAEMYRIALKKAEEEEAKNIIELDELSISLVGRELAKGLAECGKTLRIMKTTGELYNKALEDYNIREEYKRKEIIEMYKYETLKTSEKSEKEGKNIENAAEIAKKSGLAEKAMELYERLGKFEEAEKVAQRAGLTEKETLYRTIQRLIMDDKYLQKWSMRMLIPQKIEMQQAPPAYPLGGKIVIPQKAEVQFLTYKEEPPQHPPVYITKPAIIREERKEEKQQQTFLQQFLYDLGISMTKDAIYAVLRKALVVTIAGAAGAGILIAKQCNADITDTYEIPEKR